MSKESIPPMPTGDDPEARWFQWAHRLIARPFLDTPTVKFEVREDSIRANSKPVVAGASAPLPKLCRLKSISDNYVTVRTWDGTEEGETDILVARPPEIRCPASETVDGVLVTYTYATAIQRTASKTISGTTTTETQIINPRLNGNDLITAVDVDHTGITVDDTEIKKVFFSNRAWTKRA